MFFTKDPILKKVCFFWGGGGGGGVGEGQVAGEEGAIVSEFF